MIFTHTEVAYDALLFCSVVMLVVVVLCALCVGIDSGLTDMCTVKHWPADGSEHPAPSPCLFTEPTALSMVRSATEHGVKVPPFRLDYALGNARARELGIRCAVVQTEETNTLSDHFPLQCRYRRSEEEDVLGFDW